MGRSCCGKALAQPCRSPIETEWVLRSAYRITPPAIASALRGLAGLKNVTVENDTLAAQVLGGVDQGMDFADALHLSAAGICNEFVTFDASLVRAARKAGSGQVRVV